MITERTKYYDKDTSKQMAKVAVEALKEKRDMM